MTNATGVIGVGVVCLLVGCLPSVAVDAVTDKPSASTPASSGSASTPACEDGMRFAKAQCDRAARCTGNGDAGWFPTGGSCASWLGAVYATRFSISAAGDDVKACESELAARGCEATPACAGLFRDHRREANVACSATDDCKIGLACIDDVCAPRVAADAPCGHSDECAEGNSCQDRVCRPVTDGKTACRTNKECSVLRDRADGYLFGSRSEVFQGDRFACDDTTLICRAVVHDLALGAACGNGKVCGAGLYCKGWLASAQQIGVCAKEVAIGERCEDLESCLTCSNGVCEDATAKLCPSVK